MMVAIAPLLFTEEIRQTIERDECIDDAIWACVVCFPRRVVQVELSVGKKVSMTAKSGDPSRWCPKRPEIDRLMASQSAFGALLGT